MEDRLETCKNCHWWEGNDMHPSLFGIPSMTVFEKFGVESKWRCRSSEHAKDSGNPHYIETPFNFGCIHWHVKLPF